MPRNYVNKFLFSALIINWPTSILLGIYKYWVRDSVDEIQISSFFSLKKISLHDTVNVGLQELQESLKLFERHTLFMFIENVGTVFPYYFFWSLGEQTCFTTLRFGLSRLGEKYNWSLLQGLSRAGSNDFRPKDLYFQLPLKKKKKSYSSH